MTHQSGPIALLGTSADPPTCGHQALLEGLLTLFPRVITWASDNPHKSHQTSLSKRYSLLNALVQSIGSPNLELRQDLSSPWAITTLERAYERWPNSEFTFVIGSDLIGEISTWLKAEEVLKKTRIGIAPRIGWPVQSSRIKELQSIGAELDLLPLNIPFSASSDIRHKSQTDLIPPAVRQVLIEQKLYNCGSKSQ